MKTRIQKWGNSLALRIPAHFVRETKLEYHASVDMIVVDGKLVIQRDDDEPTLESLLKYVTPENIHHEEDTSKPVGKEVW
jgi:antitoxin MazE